MKVIVVGAGSFGSWSALKLLQAGCDVTLVDAWGPGNSRSSSGGESRVIRTVYGHDEMYVSMAKQAIEEWEHFQQAAGEALMEITGSLWLCGDDDSYVQAAAPKIESLGLELIELDTSTAARRWPQICFDDLRKVHWEPLSGFLRARRACSAVTKEFIRCGGRWIEAEAKPPSLGSQCEQIELSNGETVSGDHIIFAAGPWLGQLFPEALADCIQVSRQEVYYFGTPAGCCDFDHGKLPIWLELNDPIYYGIPAIDRRGFKIARDERGQDFDPGTEDRVPTPHLVEQAKSYLGGRFPRMISPPLLESRVCQYSNTLDGHFILDRHDPSGIILVGGGSGHGFKMGPVIGELVVQLVNQNHSEPAFELKRFASIRKTTTQFDHS